jgi:phenylpropionate dioxygenase-like ring-hydroxylating dioxygenase large terminal subunit
MGKRSPAVTSIHFSDSCNPCVVQQLMQQSTRDALQPSLSSAPLVTSLCPAGCAHLVHSVLSSQIHCTLFHHLLLSSAPLVTSLCPAGCAHLVHSVLSSQIHCTLFHHLLLSSTPLVTLLCSAGRARSGAQRSEQPDTPHPSSCYFAQCRTTCYFTVFCRPRTIWCTAR